MLMCFTGVLLALIKGKGTMKGTEKSVVCQPLKWIVEEKPLRIDIGPLNWSEMRTFKMNLESQRQTGARIRLEILNSQGEVVGKVAGRDQIAVDWVGLNNMQIWLTNFEPKTDAESWSDVQSVQLSCEEPGLWPTELTVGQISASADAPVWKVNESDTVIECGWNVICKPDEWEVVPEASLIVSGEYFRRPPWPWLTFGYKQGNQPGKITLERRFDMDISDYSEILSKLSWDTETLLTVIAVIDGGKEIPLIDHKAKTTDEWLTIGASLKNASRLDAGRITVEEIATRKLDDREINLELFWISLRERTSLDDAPVETVQVRLAKVHKPYPVNVQTIERRVRQIPQEEEPDSTSPIGDPMKHGLPFGFYVQRKDLPALREDALKGISKPIFDAIRAEADRAIATELVDRNYYGTAYGGGIGLPKGLNGAGMRVFAPTVAITHLITGEEKYAIAARRWILRAARSDDWGGDHGGCVQRPEIGDMLPSWDSFTRWYPKGFFAGSDNHPFQTADVSFGVVVAYDMLYHCFSSAERDEVEQSFADHGLYILYDQLRHAREFFVQMNQGILFSLPLLMMSAFLRDKDPVYNEMYEWTLEFLQEFPTRPWNKEGIPGEGPGYGAGTVMEVIEALPIIAACSGKTIKEIVPPSFMRVTDYLQHVRSTWWSDRPRFLGWSDGSEDGWIAGEILAFFANYAKDSVAQYFWNESYAENPPANLTTLFCLGHPIEARKPDLPPAKVFWDQPMAFLRTGWQYGDTLLAMNNIRQVTCHGHKDRASIILEYNGEQLLLDPGMIDYSAPAGDQYEETFCHNTMTFDQRSQLGGLSRTLPIAKVYDTLIAGFVSTSGDKCPGSLGGIDWVIADAGAVYPEAKKFLRHVIFLRPNVFILIDEVEAYKQEIIDLNFTCLGPLSEKQNMFASMAQKNDLLIYPQANQPLVHKFSMWGTHWPEIPSYRLIVSTAQPTETCTFLTVLAPYAKEAPATKIERIHVKGCLGVRVNTNDGEEYVFVRVSDEAGKIPQVETDARAVILRCVDGQLIGTALLDCQRMTSDDFKFESSAGKQDLVGALRTNGEWSICR